MSNSDDAIILNVSQLTLNHLSGDNYNYLVDRLNNYKAAKALTL